MIARNLRLSKGQGGPPLAANRTLRNAGSPAVPGDLIFRGMTEHMQPDPTKTTTKRGARAASERAALDDAERLFEQEGGIPLDEAIAWVESWETPNELPMPRPRK